MLNIIADSDKSKSLFLCNLLIMVFCLCQMPELSAQSAAWMDMGLQSIYDQELSLRTSMGEKGAVLLFLDPDCPVSQKYGNSIRQLAEQFEEKGIHTIAIYPLVQVDTAKVKSFVQEYQYNFTHLLDPQLKLTQAIEASVTPEAYLLSESGEVIYHGAINNWFYALGRYRRVVTQHYLKDAVEAYLQQKPVAQQQTEAIGCMIGTGMRPKEHH